MVIDVESAGHRVKVGLKWRLPPFLVKELVTYYIWRINIQRTMAINQNVAPRVLFTGTCADYKKELCMHFGDYCDVYDGMDNTSRSRTVPSVALYLCNDAAWAWTFLSLGTGKVMHAYDQDAA
jgi:hypothetical protein